MEEAFSPGYDPALELVTHLELDLGNSEPWTQHLRRKEQGFINLMVKGAEAGRYYVLLGPKVCRILRLLPGGFPQHSHQGTGKTTIIFEAMISIQAEGVSMCDAHPDLEVFRLRLGRALNYEFNEDSRTSLFQRKDPREGLSVLSFTWKRRLKWSCVPRHSRPRIGYRER